MRWKGGRRSENVEDRRGMRTPVGLRLPGGMGGGFGGRKAGFGGIGALVVVALVALVLGVDPRLLLEGTSGGAPYSSAPGQPPSPAADEIGRDAWRAQGCTEVKDTVGSGKLKQKK